MSSSHRDGAARKGVCEPAGREALLESAETLKALVNASPLAVVAFDADGTIRMWNPAAERMFGWTAAEVLGKPHPIVPEDKQEEFRRLRETALAGNTFTGMELRRVRKDGSPIDISVSTAPIRDEGGSITGIMSILTDVTDRKRSEEELRRLATAVEQAAEAIVITDERGAIQYVNPAFERISGYGKEEVAGKNPRILKSGRHDREFYQEFWATLLRGETWSGVFVNRRKDGALYEEEAVISPVRDASGRVANYVAVKRDVTAERRMEEQLQHAQKMEAVGRLAGGVAHDFNNLLTAITGYSELVLARLEEEDPSHRDVEEIRRAAERAATLTRQLLAFSRRQVLRPKVLDLNEVVGGMRKMLARLIGEDVELVTAFGAASGRVTADPGQIEQVLVNLAINARDAMPDGGRLVVETSDLDLDGTRAGLHDPVRPGKYVVLSVTDTGCGMDEATMSRLFEPFFTTKEVGKGTGLGLATAYGIVAQSGGHLRAESEPGRGSTFRVYLPRVDAEVPRDAAPAAPRRGSETILVAEDEEMVRELVSAVLGQQGYAVLPARDGEEALRLAEEHEGSIPLLVTDVVMPRMGGIDLAVRLRSRRPGIRVLFVSGYTDTAGKPLGVPEPGTEFLHKPFLPSVLASRVRSLIDSP
jgi:two-component system, cell cycle sensor histidine kinase and response regulator CckA